MFVPGKKSGYRHATVRASIIFQRGSLAIQERLSPATQVIICYNAAPRTAYNSRSAQRLSSKIVHGNPGKLISIALVLFHTYKMLSEEEAAARTFTARGVITFERPRTPRLYTNDFARSTAKFVLFRNYSSLSLSLSDQSLISVAYY